ncbi:MAG TPA: hypothetical protein VFZ42_05635 [Chitinophagaceae bacterium]
MEKKQEIIDLISSTCLELERFKADRNIFDASNPTKHNIYVIEIALALFQLGYFVNRPIETSEEYWFEGAYYIHYDFDGEWGVLADNYSRIVSLANRSNFFR